MPRAVPSSGQWPIDAREIHQASHGGVIEWHHVSATPLPEVREDNSESAWLEWDAAVAAGTFNNSSGEPR